MPWHDSIVFSPYLDLDNDDVDGNHEGKTDHPGHVT